MRKLIAAINMTLDGVFDHTAVNADEEIHQHYADLLRHTGTALYGRITFELMKYWQTAAENPTGIPATDDFAVLMNHLPKVVFSQTLKATEWATARLANRTLEEEVVSLKQQAGKDILVGSRSLIIQLLKLKLIDEFQLCVHPVLAGSGFSLFEEANERMTFRLIKTKPFRSGAIVLYYEPAEQATASHLT